MENIIRNQNELSTEEQNLLNTNRIYELVYTILGKQQLQTVPVTNEEKEVQLLKNGGRVTIEGKWITFEEVANCFDARYYPQLHNHSNYNFNKTENVFYKIVTHAIDKRLL